MTRTSRMEVVTRPARFGYEVVDIFFGQVRVRKNQTMAINGDLVRQIGTETVVVFKARENDQIITTPTEN